MDEFVNPNVVMGFTIWLLSFLLEATCAPHGRSVLEDDNHSQFHLPTTTEIESESAAGMQSLMQATLRNYRLCEAFNVYHEDLSFWVKPRSTTWFSRFLLEQYDNERWISMFRMTKPTVFSLAALLKPQVEKKNTRYRLAVPVLVRVACTLFKLTHGANLTICSEMFAMGRSTVSKVLREVVNAINDCLRQEIVWPRGEKMRETQAKFMALCGLPGVVGAIDGVQIPISKPDFGATDYFYFKSGGYSMNCQVVVDSKKRFLDLYVGMPGSTNDSRMLRRSSLFHLASQGTTMDATCAVDGYTPYLVGDLGYPLLPWLMVPHRDRSGLSISERLFNKKLRRGRTMVENAFGILKQSFRELLNNSDLHVTFLPDVIVCCAILHNLLLRQSHDEVEQFLHILHMEGLAISDADDEATRGDGSNQLAADTPLLMAATKRASLGVFLTTRPRL